MKWVSVFTVDVKSQEATLIYADHEGTTTYAGVIKGWYNTLDGREISGGRVWSVVEWED